MADLARTFISDSRAFLKEEYLPKIERCIAQLSEEQIWSRANGASNSIGNLLMHVAGSSRYWAVDVIGRTPTGRVRHREFDQRDPISSERLLRDLRAAMAEVDERLAALSAETLLETRTTDETVSVFWCVYHIVEHVSMHTGQILCMTKALAGELPPG